MVTSTKSSGFLILGTIGAIGLAGCSADSSGSGSAAGSTDSGSTPMSSSTAGGQDSATKSSPGTSTGAGSGKAADGQQAVKDSGVDLAKTTFPVSMDRAISVADKKVPGATMTKLALEFDKTHGRWTWKVDQQKGTKQRELKIDAGSGKVIGGESDQESGKPRAVDPKKLTPQAATKKATALVPGSVEEWALEYDDGVQRYTFAIRTHGSETQDVIVNVDTGKAMRD